MAVTPSDATNDPAGPFAGFFVGGAGAVKVHTVRGRDVVLTGCLAGTVYEVAITRVWSTGTTATNVLGLVAVPFRGPNPGVGGT